MAPVIMATVSGIRAVCGEGLTPSMVAGYVMAFGQLVCVVIVWYATTATEV
jgi:hypothetical protein